MRGLHKITALGMGSADKWHGCLRPLRRYSTRRAAQPSPRAGKSNQGTLVSFRVMGCYTGSRNRVRGLSLPICEVAESRIFPLFWSCVFRNGHSEFARPSRTHLPTFWDCRVEFLGCELFALSQTKTGSALNKTQAAPNILTLDHFVPTTPNMPLTISEWWKSVYARRATKI